MTFEHRHLDIVPGTAAEDLSLDALDDLLDRGDFDHWRTVAAAVRGDPHGQLAERILSLCRSHAMYGTSRLWPAFIDRFRGDRALGNAAESLATLRQRRGRSQTDLARALGISQSDVSKIERRHDVRLSTLRRYVEALGGKLRITAETAEGETGEPVTEVELHIGRPRDAGG